MGLLQKMSNLPLDMFYTKREGLPGKHLAKAVLTKNFYWRVLCFVLRFSNHCRCQFFLFWFTKIIDKICMHKYIRKDILIPKMALLKFRNCFTTWKKLLLELFSFSRQVITDQCVEAGIGNVIIGSTVR